MASAYSRQRSAPGSPNASSSAAAFRGRLVGVALDLHQRDGGLGLAAVAEPDGVAGILPSLVGQAAAGGVGVLQEAVAVDVGVFAGPGEGGLQVRQQGRHRTVGQAPTPGVVQQVHPQGGGVDGAVVRGRHRQPVQRDHEVVTPQLVHDLASGPSGARNTARYTFLHPEGRHVYDNWDEVAAATVAHLRAAAGAHPDAPDITSRIEELVAKSREFATLWERYDVRSRTNGRKRFSHPAVGRMTLSYEVLKVSRSDGHRLVVYQAEPGTPDHDAMLLLDLTAEAVGTLR
jgi:hypothetical protein